MTSQYEVVFSEEGPSKPTRRDARWSFLWDAIIKAFDAGNEGWATVKLPNLTEAKNAYAAIYRRRNYYQKSVAMYYRRQDDDTYVFFARLSSANKVGG